MSEFRSLTTEEEEIATAIVNAAIAVHKELGPGLLERIYEACMEYELVSEGFEVERQVSVPIEYYDVKFDEGIRLDLLINKMVIVELKAVDKVHEVWEAQILSHLKLTDLRLGFLLNFNVRLMKDGIKRFIR